MSQSNSSFGSKKPYSRSMYKRIEDYDDEDDDESGDELIIEDKIEEQPKYNNFTKREDDIEKSTFVPSREGWLINMKASSSRDKETGIDKAAIELYFIQDDATSFRAWVTYNPYFYISVKEGHQVEVESYLKKKYEGKIAKIESCDKEDLDLDNHLSGLKKRYLKIKFHNVQTLVEVRGELQPIVKRNILKSTTIEAYEDPMAKYTFAGSTSKRQNKLASEHIMDIREYDVIYYQRAAIDLDIRCGLWYQVTQESPTMPTEVKPLDRVERPDPRVLAFDIETTKAPLKFPDSSIDSIMMISYMVDRQGFLIVNREIVGADIEDFEYTPKPEYEGPFTVFNEKDEESTLRKFFSHIRELKPHIFVTYNGDMFDWPFVDARAQHYGMSLYNEIRFNLTKEEDYRGQSAVHMDAFCWVKRDSYLPHGSHGLKEVTKKKLRYNPLELDPELMVAAAQNEPETLANYSVSDAVATYYLYMTYIHPFIFSLCNIIPLNPDDVLRKGSGTLCEALLMTQAYKVNVIYPNKYIDEQRKFYKGHLLESESYAGGLVECLESGVFRYDIATHFDLDVNALTQHITNVDVIMGQAMKESGIDGEADVVNYQEIKADIVKRLNVLKENPKQMSNPLIYHLDVSAMYPNIILTNRLQPTSMVNEEICATCVYNKPENQCQRTLNWEWKGEYSPSSLSEYRLILQQLESEHFGDQHYLDLPEDEQQQLVAKRLKEYSKKVYKKNIIKSTEIRADTVCMRENSFYVDTVKLFRDRRYVYKALHSEWKGNYDTATKGQGPHDVQKCSGMVIMYESMQLAHKCILNSFYGYVKRKGSRWYSMEMAGIVTHTGSNIIKNARESVEQLGRPLELDTDGIWCILPSQFPEEYSLKTTNGKSKKFNFLNVLLNLKLAESFTNHQYQEFDPKTNTYVTRDECSIQFESDGPYGCMFIPTGKEKGVKLKKRYAVFNKQGGICELKGFEIKRRGELELIKSFQTELFQFFNAGDTLETCYNAIASVANKWMDVLDSHADGYEDMELIRLITESSKMSKKLSEYGDQKSTAISTALKLKEFLGDEIVKDAGLACKYFISNKPAGAPVTQRTIPVEIFRTEVETRNSFLRSWTKTSDVELRNIIDWDYYRQRLGGVIQKMITLPAALQNISNPVPRVPHPEWILKEIRLQTESRHQTSITSFFDKIKSTITEDGTIGDIEDIFEQRFAKMPKPVFTKHKKRLKSKQIELDDGQEVEEQEEEDDQDENSDPNGNKKKKKNTKNASIRDFFGLKSKDQDDAKDLGKAPSYDDDFQGWLEYRKKSWRKLRAKIKARKNEKGLWSTDANDDMSIGRATTHQFFTSQNEAVKLGLWQIVSIEEIESSPGIYLFWSLIGDSMIPIKIQIDRTFYLNCTQEDPYQGGEKRNSLLPRSKERRNLFEYSMSEVAYLENSKDLNTLFTHPSMEGVYESKIPLDLMAIIKLGCVASMKRQVSNTIMKQPHNNNTKYRMDQMQGRPEKLNNYLAESNFHQIYLYHNSKEGKDGVFALISSHNNTANIIFANPYVGGSNMSQRVLNPLKEKFPDLQFVMQVQTSMEKARKAVNHLLQDYSAQRKGATIIITQMFDVQEKFADIPMLREFPKVMMPPHEQDSQYSPFNWETHCLKPLLTRYGEVRQWWLHYVSIARYSNVPIGNLTGNYASLISDVEYCRLLKESNHLLWLSMSNCPDLGGSEEDDAKFHEELTKVEINQPGCYNTVCFELNLLGLAVNTILESSHITNIEGIMGAQLSTNGSDESDTFGLPDQNNKKEDPSTFFDKAKAKVGGLDHINSCEKEFTILKKLITKWSLDLVMGSRRYNQQSDLLLTHFYRWVSSPYSGMYDPVIHRHLHLLMQKVFYQLVRELEKLGSKIIYGSFNKLIVCSQKDTMDDAQAYCKYILSVIKKKELFSWLDIKPTKFWYNVLWMDASNYSGILYTEPSTNATQPTQQSQHQTQPLHQPSQQSQVSNASSSSTSPDTNNKIDGSLESHWNIAEFLPQSVNNSFVLVISDFIRKLYIHRQSIRIHEVLSEPKDEMDVGEEEEKPIEDKKKYKNKKLNGNNNKDDQVSEDESNNNSDQESSKKKKKKTNGNYNSLRESTTWNENEESPFKWDKVVDCHRIYQIVQSLKYSDHNDTIHKFPVLPGSHLQFNNPSLEFVKFVCHVLSLDKTIASNVQRLRKNLMKMINIREFSDEAKFQDPCLSFIIPDIICSHCYQCRDIDLLREDNQGVLVCTQCQNAYNQNQIENMLVEIIQRRSLTYHLQDFNCQKCGQIKSDNLSEICSKCSGNWQCGQSNSSFHQDLTIFQNVATHYKFEWLNEIVKGLNL